MNKYIIITAINILIVQQLFAQGAIGKVENEKGEPLTFVNVVLLSRNDSAFIAGTISREDGSFSIASGNGGIIKASSIGYKTTYKDCSNTNVGIIKLVEDSKMLDEVVVKSPLPKTILKDGGMLTTIAGTILEKTGAMEQLLDRIPNVMAKDGKIEVFGRGTPEIYINGRKMRDKMELERLQPDEIKNIEVISTPGARYAASVKSVIRITTKKPVGKGIGIDAKTSIKMNEQKRMSSYDNLQLYYLKGGFSLNTQLYGAYNHIQDNKQLRQITYIDKTWKQTNNISQEYTNVNPYLRLATSYMFNEENSLGASISYDRYAKHLDRGNMVSTTLCNEELYEQSASHFIAPDRSTDLYANSYYTGKIGRMSIDFNTDWYWSGNKEQMQNKESYTQTGGILQEQEVDSKRNTYSQLFASKLVLARPLLSGNLSWGGEYSSLKRKSRYNVLPTSFIGDENSIVKESMTSAFVDYSRDFGKLSFHAGLRYEFVNFKYYDHDEYIGSQSKTYSNLFPSLALSYPIGKIQMQLTYASDIYRPSYYELRNGIQYDNRYTYESGNPFLIPAISKNVSYAFSWKWLNFSTMFTHVSDEIRLLMQTYKDDPKIILARPENMGGYNKMQTTLSLAPTFGIWHPSLEMAAYKQWLKQNTHEGNSQSHPIGTFKLTNTFDTKWLTASLMMKVQTEGTMGNEFMRKGYFGTDFSLYKSLLHKRLTLQFYVSDLFRTADEHRIFYSGSQHITYHDSYSSSSATFTIRYRLNATDNKYKGVGAGQSQRKRM